MISIDDVSVYGLRQAIHGMRNSRESWDESDSIIAGDRCTIGENDRKLMRRLRDGGPSERKFMRMINIYANVTAPLYWWKQMDTYTVGKVQNSGSTMYNLDKREFSLDDFAHDAVGGDLKLTIDRLNFARSKYLQTRDANHWRAMVQMLPESYLQYRSLMLSYEVMRKIYVERKDHKLTEWHEFIDQMIAKIPVSWLITG